MAIRMIALGIVLLWVSGSRAGIYQPSQGFDFELNDQGYATPIQFNNGFDGIYKELRDIMRPGSPLNQKYTQRVQELSREPISKLTSDELAELTASLLRLNRPNEVLSKLQVISRDPRKGDYLVYNHMAHAFYMRGADELIHAYRHQMITKTLPFPKKFGRLSEKELAWLKRVELDYYLPWMGYRADEVRRSPGLRDISKDQIDPIFPTAPPLKNTEPVQFIDENGGYSAGKIAPQEMAKLPPDAIAIVQQMLMWHPSDPRLCWLLAELYNAHGQVETALKMMDDCSFSLGYLNDTMKQHRRVLRDHVESLYAERETQRKEEEAKKQAEIDAENARLLAERRERIWIISIVIGFGLVVAIFQIRVIYQRVQRWRRAN
ncbi:MAG: hypothetical protein R3B84_21975 [Zavarzinella sp.]